MQYDKQVYHGPVTCSLSNVNGPVTCPLQACLKDNANQATFGCGKHYWVNKRCLDATFAEYNKKFHIGIFFKNALISKGNITISFRPFKPLKY